MNKLKKILYAVGIGVFFFQAFLNTACSNWTEIETKDNYVEPLTKGYKNNIKDYLNSPDHKLMYGWFGNWTGKGGSMQFALCGLPDSVDFVSLWLNFGNLTEAQKTDLKEFQERGSKALFCWRAGNIGDHLTPGVVESGEKDEKEANLKKKEAFWKYDRNDVNSCVEAAKKYALAIVDSCDKYNIDGFDYDMEIEDFGTLLNTGKTKIANTFLATLREEFTKKGKILMIDIPADVTNVSQIYSYILEEKTLLAVDYIAWQSYTKGHKQLDRFFEDVKEKKRSIFEEVMRKSIVTGTFERASDKHFFVEQQTYHPACGIEHAGMGAYHIEYDYPGNPDYSTVRAAIAKQNPPIFK